MQLKGRSFSRLSPSGLAGGYFALWVAERTAQLAEAFHGWRALALAHGLRACWSTAT